jgi:hypothetical protein
LAYVPRPISISPSNIIYGVTVGPPSVVDTLERLVPSSGFCYASSYGGTYCESSGSSYAPMWNQTTTVSSLQELNASIVPQAGSYSQSQAGFFISGASPPVLAYSASYGYFNSINGLAALDMALTDTSVAVSYTSFGGRYVPRDFYQSLVAVFTTIGFCLFPGLFALYPTRERLQKVRAMQYSNGITSGPLWTAYALFDFCFLLVISVLVTVIWLTNGYAYYGLGLLFL